jgi:DNA-binding NtrC family response regulator
VKGAFTGATGDRTGKLRVADGGTLFLDEVESLPPAAQDFLLDVLEGSGNFAPWGAPGDLRVAAPRFRLISASKKTLAQSGLRPDLCQRLAAGDVITIPGLEERREQIPELIASFLLRLRDEQGLDAVFTDDAARFLSEASWPGQIRELEATVRAVVARNHAEQQLDGTQSRRLVMGLDAVREYLKQRWASFGPEIPPTRMNIDVTEIRGEAVLGKPIVELTHARKRPVDLTAEDLKAALAASSGNKKRAADALGIALNTLKSKMRALGLG